MFFVFHKNMGTQTCLAVHTTYVFVERKEKKCHYFWIEIDILKYLYPYLFFLIHEQVILTSRPQWLS